MRIGCIDGADSSSISTAESKEHWFNPPRNDTDDKPLEIEWYMYMDASTWGSTPQERFKNGITSNNWSAFWAFGKGQAPYDWPNGGEIDFAEWLPGFGNEEGGKGLATGLHNGSLREYPPCCLDISDPVSFGPTARYALKGSGWNKPPISVTAYDPITKIPTNVVLDGDSSNIPKTAITSPTQGGFNTWGYALAKGYFKDYINALLSNRDYTENTGLSLADQLTYNNVLHCYARMTTKNLSIWAKPFADPTNPPPIKTKPTDMNKDIDVQFRKYGYTMVANAYADFGSNADDTYHGIQQPKDSPPPYRKTNWHQNMCFVWAAILSKGSSRNMATDPGFHNSILFYLSDIHMRGGGNYTKAMPPEVVAGGDPRQASIAPFTTDPTSNSVCNYRFGPDTCENRLLNAGLYSK